MRRIDICNDALRRDEQTVTVYEKRQSANMRWAG